MSEAAYTLFGIETPEQVRARIGKAREEKLLGEMQMMGYKNPAQRMAHMAGANLGSGILGLMGAPENPELTRAKQMQSIIGSIDSGDFATDPAKAYRAMSAKLASMNQYDLATKALSTALEIENTRSQIDARKPTAKDPKGGQSLQIQEPGSLEPVAGFFNPNDNKHYVYNNDGTVRQAHPKSKVFGKSTIQGTKKDFGMGQNAIEKRIQEMDDMHVKTVNTVQAVQDLKGYVASPDFVGGITGQGLQLINSLRQQVSQFISREPLMTSDGKYNPKVIGKLNAENADTLERAAINADVREAAIIDLAYIYAKQRDPDGRLSDADVNFARKTLDGSADRRSVIMSLEGVQKRAVRNYNNRARLYNKREKDSRYELIDLNKLAGESGSESDKNADAIADKLLKESGL